QLDLLATDFFHDRAYPSYLYYNPYDESRTVSVSVGEKPVDLYDAVRNEFVARKVTKDATFSLDPDTAAVIVLVPAGATLTYDGRRTLAGGVVIDYDNGRVACPALKPPPAVKDVSRVATADRATINVDGDPADWAKLKSQPIHLDTGGR